MLELGQGVDRDLSSTDAGLEHFQAQQVGHHFGELCDGGGGDEFGLTVLACNV